MILRFLCFSLTLLVAFSSSVLALDQPFDHSLWDQFLKKYVNERGEMNYEAAKEDPSLLNAYLDQISKIKDAKKWPREESFALWLNLYHAALVKAILDHYPVKSIQDIPGVWELEIFKMKTERYSLNRIQNDELVKTFGDEKILMALACSGHSCPKWRREAFTGPRLDGQLFLCAREFVNDPERNKIVAGDKKIWLSRIFKWYAGNFTLDFGTAENDRGLTPQEFAVLSFIAHYLEDAKKIQYLEEGNYKIKYLPFDWSLSEWRSGK